MSLPPDPFGRTKPPSGFDRADRVRLLHIAARALVAGEEVPRDAALFLGGAVEGWLASGGDLEGSFLQLRAPRGCHHTPSVLFRRLQDAPDAADGLIEHEGGP